MKAYTKQTRIGGIIVTVKGMPENGAVSQHGIPYDFLSRYFDPWNGIDEDPVTGIQIRETLLILLCSFNMYLQGKFREFDS